MRKLLLPLVGLLAFAVGCRMLDALNPFSDEWIESPNYAPIEYDKAWTILKSNMPEWEFETADKDDGEIETLWKPSQQYRVKAQVRLYEVEEEGREGVRFELRVLRQRPKDIWSPLRTKYDDWVDEDPDAMRQETLMRRFDYWLRDAMRRQELADAAQSAEE